MHLSFLLILFISNSSKLIDELISEIDEYNPEFNSQLHKKFNLSTLFYGKIKYEEYKLNVDDSEYEKRLVDFIHKVVEVYYYETVSLREIKDMFNNISETIELLEVKTSKNIILNKILIFFIFIITIDNKYKVGHNFDSTLFLKLLDVKSFLFIEHYYKGVGGDESSFFIDDYRSGFDQNISNLISSRCIIKGKDSGVKMFNQYSLNTNQLSFENFKQILTICHEGPIIRVQRSPKNDDQRVHTSTIGAMFITIPLSQNINKVINDVMDDKYLEFTAFKASGAGGQHVNKTSSAVRLTNSLLEISTTSQEERSQIANRKKAKDKMMVEIRQKFTDISQIVLKSHIINMDRNQKTETFNYKRNMIHFHETYVLDNPSISIGIFNGSDYCSKIYQKYMQFLYQ